MSSAIRFRPIIMTSLAFIGGRHVIDGYKHPAYGDQPALARTVINKRVVRIRKLFSWATGEELIPEQVHVALKTLDGLKRGRSKAKETEGVLPIARSVVEDTLPLLRPMIADMVRLQLETGMRPGELVIMRPRDIDMSGFCWLYRPAHDDGSPAHKTAYLGHDRTVPIGPQGQAIVRRWLPTSTEAYIFSPRLAMEQRHAERRKGRVTKLWPSHIVAQAKKRKRQPKRPPREFYSVTAYARSIAESIKRHNECRPEGERLPHWHPHQLRHLRALELKRAAGLDAARAVLGHKCPAITEHYATLDLAKGVEIMSKMG
jgi:integrase